MKTMYLIKLYQSLLVDKNNKIIVDKVEVEDETSHFVILRGGTRKKKKSQYENFFDTREEAIEAGLEYIKDVIKRTESKIEFHKYQMEILKEILEKNKG